MVECSSKNDIHVVPGCTEPTASCLKSLVQGLFDMLLHALSVGEGERAPLLKC